MNMCILRGHLIEKISLKAQFVDECGDQIYDHNQSQCEGGQ